MCKSLDMNDMVKLSFKVVLWDLPFKDLLQYKSFEENNVMRHL